MRGTEFLPYAHHILLAKIHAYKHAHSFDDSIRLAYQQQGETDHESAKSALQNPPRGGLRFANTLNFSFKRGINTF